MYELCNLPDIFITNDYFLPSFENELSGLETDLVEIGYTYFHFIFKPSPEALRKELCIFIDYVRELIL